MNVDFQSNDERVHLYTPEEIVDILINTGAIGGVTMADLGCAYVESGNSLVAEFCSGKVRVDFDEDAIADAVCDITACAWGVDGDGHDVLAAIMKE